MKISIIQCDLKVGDVDYNFSLVEKKIIEAMEDNPDVIVLPEMWNTSFFPHNIRELADVDGRRTKELLKRLSSKFNVNIVGGSVARLSGDKLFNTCYVFDRNGNEINHYDKVHAFSPSKENEVFNTGSNICTFNLDNIKCGVIICYDIRFVEWVRMYALDDVQILFIPAAWPDKRNLHWDTLNRARAIENQMFVVCVNSVGSTDDMKFGGHSAIIDPWGEYIIKPDDSDSIRCADIDLDVIKGIRESINVFRDRKKDLYELGGKNEI